MNARQYMYVSTLARELNFSRAAEELGITQPTLSQFIKKVEAEIGTELFSRNGFEVKLTDAGRIYLEYGKKIINLQHGMEDALIDISEYKTGKLRMALSPCRCDTIMPEVVKKFRKKYPGIQVSIQEILAGGLLRGIENDDFDIGVTPMPQNTSGYVCEPILREEILLAVPSDGELNAFLSKEACSLEGHLYPAVDFKRFHRSDFIVMQEWQGMQKQLLTLCEECDIQINPVLECTNNRTMTMMVQQGIGCALIPSSIIRQNERAKYDNITLYSLLQNPPIREMVTIYRKNKRLSEPAKYMLALLKNIQNN